MRNVAFLLLLISFSANAVVIRDDVPDYVVILQVLKAL